ncbi:6287_t:CDS:2 [Racocetra fulgida]|uniref:6287_t:CDS:1 n=1 Tax=Racocetra fulgida TaxID=60492 RepID=A0A9N9F8C7_9GLOM|nr:6287_t:CDS:2 [Racocetra fulgida]
MFQMAKGWASPTYAKFRKKGDEKRIKPKVVNILKQFFLNENLNLKDKMIAKEMRDELLKFMHFGEIKEDHVPQLNTIKKGTAITLETFKAASFSLEQKLVNL